MKQGDVILTPVPQADGNLKNRPAIFLREMPPYRDLLEISTFAKASQRLSHSINLEPQINADENRSICLHPRYLWLNILSLIYTYCIHNRGRNHSRLRVRVGRGIRGRCRSCWT